MPDDRRRRGRTLNTRITLLVVGVATLVTVVAGVASLQLVRGALEQQAHEHLATQVGILAEEGDLETAARQAQAWAQDVGDQWAVVASDGSVRGSARRWVDAEVARDVLAGTAVSDTTRAWRAPVILEAQPVGAGGIVLARPESAIAAATRELVARFLPIIGAAAIAAILGGVLLAGRIASPLVATANAANVLACGRRGVAVPGSDIPEVDDVAHALAALDSALVASEGRQREFLLSVSHELRTPLTAIRGYAEALADGLVDSASVASVGRTLTAETERVDHFVGDLLELARLESDDFRIEPSPVDLAALLREAAEAWAAKAAALGVAIVVDADAAPTVVSDPRRVRQLVDGLVENALRVSPPDSALELRAAAAPGAGGGAAIAVRDEGPGLSDDDLARAFDRSVLRERYGSSRPVGTGLGLSIAQRLAARLGGSVSAARAPGGGSVFTVDLPSGVSPRAPGSAW
ncbi:sensor histidine kinase [Agromyces bauzanensis]|uniref:histidine kinase n=1 Tax=Agromyces bauzanensis TaxID=1308924 RepID=A0A917PLR3_9MICO|nr:HAMP domain-containing sensor histidine kinase [Agromyces bauzanensis]GGJ83693.1 two-component sensor histidine kinase [Agromyces bauzanensis]